MLMVELRTLIFNKKGSPTFHSSNLQKKPYIRIYTAQYFNKIDVI